MIRRTTWRALCAAVALGGCGGAAPHPATAAAVEVGRGEATRAATAVAVAPPPPFLTRRVASSAVRLRWPFDESATFAVHADVQGLLRTPLLTEWAPAVLARSGLGAEDAACARALLTSARELVAGSDARGALVVLRFDPEAASRSPRDCLARWPAAAVDGAAEAYRVGGPIQLVAVLPGILLIGDEGAVAAALRKKTAGPWPAALSLTPHRYVAGTARAMGGQVRGRGEISVEPAHLRVGMEATVPAMLGPALEAQIGRWIGAADAPEEGDARALLRRAFVFDRDGGQVRAALDLRGSTAAQARDIAILVAFATRLLGGPDPTAPSP